MHIDLYLHSDKESNRSDGERAGLSEAAMDQFIYTAYEVKLTYDVDIVTGKSVLVRVDNRTLGPKAVKP